MAGRRQELFLPTGKRLTSSFGSFWKTWDEPPPVGSAAPETPAAKTLNPVTITVGGIAAAVSFAGLAAGMTGMYEIRATLPAGVAPGNAVPVVVTVAGQVSPPVTMAIR